MNSKFLYYIFSSLLLVLFYSNVLAQEKDLVIRGQVKSDTGEPIPMVSIVEVDANKRFISGTVSDINGNYQLKVSRPNATIIFQCISYQPDTVVLQNERVRNVVLTDKMNELETVVVTASKVVSNGMFDRNEKDILSATSTLSMKDVEDLGVVSVDEALQGRLTNVDVTYNSGDPGAGMSIKMRNVSSLTSTTNPLIVIDDVPQNMTIDPAFNFGTANDQEYGALLNLDPQDIESITALTDAAAAAVYGARGGNGVLLIKTKRGKKGNTKISYSGKYTMSYQPEAIPMLNGDSYTMMMLESFVNRAGVYGIPQNIQEFTYDKNWAGYYNYNKNTDWLKEITRIGSTHSHNLSVTGGGDKAQYLYSFSYTNQIGTTIGTAFKRFTNKVNFDYMISEKLKILADISFTNSTTNGNPDDIRDVAFQRMPNLSVYQYDDQGNTEYEYFTTQGGVLFQADRNYKYNPDKDKNTYNPVAMARLASDNLYSNTINTRFQLNYFMTNWLRFISSVAFSSDNDKAKTFIPFTATGQVWNDASANKATNKTTHRFSINTRNQLTISNILGEDHALSANFLVLNNINRGYSENITITNTPNPGLDEVVSPAIVSKLENANSLSKGIDLISNISYIFREKYKFEGSYSRTADSDRGKNKLWDNNVGLAVGWDISKENFMKQQDIITQLQLRADMGMVGSPVGKKEGQFVRIGTDANLGAYNGMSALIPLNIQQSELRPERKIEYDYGFDLELFKKVNLHFNYYISTRKDQYATVKLPASSGYTEYGINMGSSITRGFDVTLNATLYKSEAWNVLFRFNLSNSMTELTELNKNYSQQEDDVLSNGKYLVSKEINKPDGSFYGYHYLGVFRYTSDAVVRNENGDIVMDYSGLPKRIVMGNSSRYTFTGGDAIYEDLNNDGIINALDVRYLGTKNPDFFGSIGPTVTYKNITLSTFFNYRYGNSIINKIAINTQKMHGMENQSKAVLGRWRNEGDPADVPRALYNYGYNWLGSDRFVEDGSFIRFKQLSLSYSFNKKFIQRLGISNLKTWVSATNLYTWTNYTGQDPEGLADGLYDEGYTPPSRNFLLGLDVTF